jgi:hypothetical protein
LGSTFELADRGNSYTAGTVVTVYLVDNKVEWWREIIPSDNDAGDKGDIIRR